MEKLPEVLHKSLITLAFMRPACLVPMHFHMKIDENFKIFNFYLYSEPSIIAMVFEVYAWLVARCFRFYNGQPLKYVLFCTFLSF